MTEQPSTVTLRVWDLPTRVFHWLLAVLVIAAVVTANVGGNAIEWHMRIGCAILALLVFRLVWGLVGGYWSRWRRLVHAPGTVLDYLRGDAGPHGIREVGHSPTGSLSVLAMLLLLCAQVATGLMADDEIATVGPLNHLVSGATASAATSWHTGWGRGLLIALVVLHVSAIIFYATRGKRLVPAMLHGDKELPLRDVAGAAIEASTDTAGTRVLALGLAVASGALGWWVYSLG